MKLRRNWQTRRTQNPVATKHIRFMPQSAPPRSVKKLPDVLSRQGSEIVAIDYFRRLGHDNHRRLSRLYAWEEKKSKTSWGAESLDYEKIAAAPVQAMKAADLNRFVVVCALVSDLYCPGYNPRQSLAKDSILWRTAARYKVDTARVAAAVRAELRQEKDVRKRSGKATAIKTMNCQQGGKQLENRKHAGLCSDEATLSCRRCAALSIKVFI